MVYKKQQNNYIKANTDNSERTHVKINAAQGMAAPNELHFYSHPNPPSPPVQMLARSIWCQSGHQISYPEAHGTN